jgi:hypothetical protein
MKRSWASQLRHLTHRQVSQHPQPQPHTQTQAAPPLAGETIAAIDEELKLPDRASLVIVLMANVLMQVSGSVCMRLTFS